LGKRFICDVRPWFRVGVESRQTPQHSSANAMYSFRSAGKPLGELIS
jgi:hypothetical protein